MKYLLGVMFMIFFLVISQTSIVKSQLLTDSSVYDLTDIAVHVGVETIKTALRVNELQKTEEAQKCFRDIEKIQIAFQEGETWAFQVLDSSAKFSLSLFFPVSASTCRRVQKLRSPVDVHFCYLEIAVEEDIGNITLPIGVCLPSSCSENLINKFASQIHEIIKLSSEVDFNVDLKCSYEVGLSFEAKAIMAFCAILIVLATVATIYDLKTRSKIEQNIGIRKKIDKQVRNSKDGVLVETKRPPFPSAKGSVLSKFLLCFSATTNIKQLFKLQQSPHEFPILNGLRALSLLGVFLGHVGMLYLLNDNPSDILLITSFYPANIFFSTIYTMNVFFLISGFLTTYNFLTHIDKGIEISWTKRILFRFLRISPVFWTVLLIQWKFSEYLFPSQLNWLFLMTDKSCRNNWWMSAFYIQTFLPQQEQCFPITWYLSSDMQLYIFSLLILAIMRRSTRYMLIVCISLIMASMTAVSILASHYEIEFFFTSELTIEKLKTFKTKSFESKLYLQPWFRCNAYLIGMICALVLYRTKCKKRLTKIQVTLLWSLSLLICLPTLFVMNQLQLSPVLSGLYLNFYGTIWPIGLAIIIFLCCSGYGNIITVILSWKIWGPLNRLTLSAFLCQMMVFQWIIYVNDESFHMNYANMFVYFTYAVQFVLFFGAVLHVLVERPFTKIVYLLFT